MKGISLNEAIEKSGINISDLAAENKKKRDRELAEIVKKLDLIISVEILRILQGPISKDFWISGWYNNEKEITSLYSDFTVKFSATTGVVHIKLADKDWDWKGYGIKEEKPIPSPAPQKKNSLFSFLR